MSFRAVRGMKDLYGIDMDKYCYLVNKSLEVSKMFGYKLIETPILEYSEVFQRSIGDDTDVVSKEMYTFDDRGGESVTLRPEGTAGVIRAVVAENLIDVLPLKIMYYGQMFRYDRPQKGRFRQFHQIGFENIENNKDPYTDALVIALASAILHSIGIFDFSISLNTLGDSETRALYSKAIMKYFSRHENMLSEDSKRRLSKNPLRILDSKDSQDIEICQMAPIISDYLTRDSGIFFDEVCRLLEIYGLNYKTDTFLVRGLDYYSHTIFEVKLNKDEKIGAIGGGGRYDNLIKEFGGPDISGIGFAFGVERIMSVLDDLVFENSKSDFKISVISLSDNENDEAFKLLKKLYSSSISAEFINSGSINKRMKVADKNGSDMALIIGESEKQNKTVTVKFLRKNDIESKNISVGEAQIIEFIKYYLQ